MTRFRVELTIDNSGVRLPLEQLFATREEAEASARELAERWALLVRSWHIVEVEDTTDDSKRS